MPRTDKKYFFVADSHLGSLLFKNKKEKNERFIKWLELIAPQAKEIFLLGDIFDFWFEFAHSIPPGYDDVLNDLKKLTSKGLKIHFFCGNHDQWTFGYLQNECGLIVHKKAEIIKLENKTFFLAHGHGLGEKRLGAKIVNTIFESKALQWGFRHLIIPKIGLTFGYKWSSNNRKKHENVHKEYEYHNYYVKQNSDNNAFQVEWAKEYAKENRGIDYIIMGHLHEEINMMLGTGTHLLILDEFFNRYGYAVFDGENLYPCNFE